MNFLNIYIYIYLSIYLPTYLSIYLSIYLYSCCMTLNNSDLAAQPVPSWPEIPFLPVPRDLSNFATHRFNLARSDVGNGWKWLWKPSPQTNP